MSSNTYILEYTLDYIGQIRVLAVALFELFGRPCQLIAVRSAFSAAVGGGELHV